MNRLLRANFSRLWKSKIFWIEMMVMLVYAIVFLLNGSRQAAVMPEYNYTLDNYYFHFALSIGVFCLLFTSLFTGTEYSDGTLRNKLVVGHTRTNIYLANLLTNFSATFMIVGAWIMGAMVGVPTLGFLKMGYKQQMFYLAIIILLAAVFSAIFTFIAMLSSNKTMTVVIAAILFLGLLICSLKLYSALVQPEMVSGVSVNVDEMYVTEMYMTEPAPNPKYVGGTLRKVYEFILDVSPCGQSFRVALLEVVRPVRMLISSAIITVIVTFGGIVLFKRKDIK